MVNGNLRALGVWSLRPARGSYSIRHGPFNGASLSESIAPYMREKFLKLDVLPRYWCRVISCVKAGNRGPHSLSRACTGTCMPFVSSLTR